MRKILFVSLLAICATLCLCSCEKATIDQGSSNVAYDPNAPLDSVFFSTDILPIFASNCASCHTSQVPVLEASVAYSNVLNGYVDAGAPSTSILYLKLTSPGSTHEGRSTQAQQDLIFQWINQGGLNN